MDLDEFQKLKKEVDSAKQEAAEAEGAAKQILAALKKEFGCSSLEEARRLLKKLEAERGSLKRRLARKLDKFKNRWKKEL